LLPNGIIETTTTVELKTTWCV